MDTFNYIVNRFNNNQQHSREELGILFKELGFTIGVEIGVERGIFSKLLCEANPNLKLYCVDPWSEYSDFESRADQHIFNINYVKTQKRLKDYNCTIIRKTSMEALKDFDNNSLDFVYIDGNHEYDYVYEDIAEWTKKVKPGGIVCGDDYNWYHRKRLLADVKVAVDLYIKENNKTLVLLKERRAVNWLFVK